MTLSAHDTHHLQKNGHVFERGTGAHIGKITRVGGRSQRKGSWIAETAEGLSNTHDSQYAALVWLAGQKKG